MEYLSNRWEFWLDFWPKMKLRMCSTKLWMWAVAYFGHLDFKLLKNCSECRFCPTENGISQQPLGVLTWFLTENEAKNVLYEIMNVGCCLFWPFGLQIVEKLLRMPFLPHGKWNISPTAGSFDMISDRKWSWECPLQNYVSGLLLILAICPSNYWKTAQHAVFAPRKMEYLRNRLEFWLDFWLKMKLRMCSTKLWMWAVAHFGNLDFKKLKNCPKSHPWTTRQVLLTTLSPDHKENISPKHLYG